jgi:hypothetical protein
MFLSSLSSLELSLALFHELTHGLEKQPAKLAPSDTQGLDDLCPTMFAGQRYVALILQRSLG